MGIEVRTPTDDDWAQLAYVDGRAFGMTYDQKELEDQRPLLDLSRFRVACDGPEIVGVVGSFALDVTVPGGTTVPMGGVTWVSVSATHRRQGILTRLMQECHGDIDERGEPAATLGASESGIYERFGYGAATFVRGTRIDIRGVELRAEFRPAAGSVRYMGHDEAATAVPELWDRYRRTRVGEVSRDQTWHDRILGVWSRERDEASEGFFLHHADGYAAYRVTQRWNDGFPHHELTLNEFAAVTPDAHAALWHTLLNIDLVGTIVSRQIPIDDPLPYLLNDFRALRTTNLHDGIWVNVRDIPICFGARNYATEDRLVVEVSDGPEQGKRFAIEGGPDGGSCRAVRTKPDLTLTHAALGALLYGGVRASGLAAGRRLTARNADVLRRADLFFTTSQAPLCQTMY